MGDQDRSTDVVELTLLRHADAGDSLAWPGPDEDRPLSAKGERQTERLGRHLETIGFEADVIVSSPKLRAFQTATIVSRFLARDVVISDRLGDGLDLASLEELLDEAGDPLRPLLVGHDPDFSAIVSELASAPGILVRKGALVRIDATRPLSPGSGSLRWLLPPEALRSR